MKNNKSQRGSAVVGFILIPLVASGLLMGAAKISGMCSKPAPGSIAAIADNSTPKDVQTYTGLKTEK